MKYIVLILIMSVVQLPSASFAKTAKMNKTSKSSSKKIKSSNRMGAKLGTQFDFDAMSVHGRYQTGFEGLSTVENEKALNDLLDYRTELKDRIKQSANYVVSEDKK
jgi:hypothetical protein